MSRSIPIYKAEAELADKILSESASCIAYQSRATVSRAIELCSDSSFLSKLKSKASANQPDLYYFDSILVTTGMNLNDDVFLPAEVWAARHTPEDKQTNYQHNEKEIIGHITACYAIDDKMDLLSFDSKIDELPEKFHLVTAGVLYTKWEDVELSKKVQNVIEEISKGTIFVSMECLFYNFDYAISRSNCQQEIISRNEETAFLTKHLRAYGGSGVYKDSKIGRLLRHITFSGKGIVKQPANPESVIFSGTSPFKGKVKNKLIEDGEKINMSTAEVKTLEDSGLSHEVKSLKEALAEMKLERDQAKAKADADAKAAVEAQIATLKTNLKNRDDEVAGLTKQLADSTKANEAKISDLEKKLSDAETASKAVSDELTKIKSEARKASRITALEKAGHSAEKSIELEAKFASLDDNAFAGVLEIAKVERKVEKTDAADDADKNDKNADVKVLDKVTASADAKLALEASEDENAKLAFAELTKAFAGVVNKNASKKSNKIEVE